MLIYIAHGTSNERPWVRFSTENGVRPELSVTVHCDEETAGVQWDDVVNALQRLKWMAHEKENPNGA